MDKIQLKEVIKQFVKRAINRDSQQYKEFFNNDELYNNFIVKISFGQGNFANKPWLAFLKNGNQVNNGIYPTISYFYQQQKLVIGKGVSDENPSRQRWVIQSDKDKPWSSLNYGNTCVDCYYREVFDIKTANDLDENILDKLIGHLDGIMQDFPNLRNVPTSTINTKNIIFYGPPGVGKTYNHKKLISLIESGVDQKEIFDAIKNGNLNVDEAKFEEVKNDGRFKFVTFHQSYSYEDFIEGFRPNEDGDIKLEDGIFKEIAEDARENLLRSKMRDEIFFKDALSLLLKDKIENEESVKIDLKRSGSYYKIYDYNDRTIFFEKQNGDKTHSLSIKTLQKMYEYGENSIIHGGLAPYYNPLLDELLKIKNQNTIEKVEQKNYYLLIDEINRGNISKIFGELITLIEDDKRDEIEVTLPYSKDPFKVPSNLYIIATMNSTDKSIALIDIALRRRFTFLNMKPDDSLVHADVREIFGELNQYIERKLGKDYLIGHSYFDKNKELDLEFVLEYKIIPLMEEYFYGDDAGLEKIKEILDCQN